MVSSTVLRRDKTMAISESYQISIVAGLIEEQLDPKHELLVLANKLDWEAIHHAVKPYYKLIGRNGKGSRLMVGLLILKHRLKLSDECLVAGLKENLYWRTFCGLSGQLGIWRQEDVLNSSSLTRFRKRLGAAGLREIERCIQKQMVAGGFIDPTAMYIDTTAQEKNIAYPVDTHLLNKGQEKLRSGIKKLIRMGLKIEAPRNFSRKAKRHVIIAAKLGGNRKERIQKSNKELININREVQKSVAQQDRPKANSESQRRS